MRISDRYASRLLKGHPEQETGDVPRGYTRRRTAGEWPTLQLAVAAVPEWMRDAACVEHPELDFFGDRGGWEPVSQALAVCRGCLVAEECGQYATQFRVRDGVWGGEARSKPRAQPRTAPARVGPNLDERLVYFAATREGGFIKIGCSDVPQRRVRELGLVLLATEPGSFAREHALHYVFDAARSHGEYFRATPALLAYIADLRKRAEQVAS